MLIIAIIIKQEMESRVIKGRNITILKYLNEYC